MADNRLVAVCLECADGERVWRKTVAKFNYHDGWYLLDAAPVNDFFRDHNHGTANGIVFVPESCERKELWGKDEPEIARLVAELLHSEDES